MGSGAWTQAQAPAKVVPSSSLGGTAFIARRLAAGLPAPVGRVMNGSPPAANIAAPAFADASFEAPESPMVTAAALALAPHPKEGASWHVGGVMESMSDAPRATRIDEGAEEIGAPPQVVGHSTNLVGLPTDFIASRDFNDEPQSLHISGVREMNPQLFEMLSLAGSMAEAA